MRLILNAAAAALSILAWCAPANAQAPKPLFASDEILHITLKGPLANMPRGNDQKPLAGVLTVEGGATESLPVGLTTRGITRRLRQICAFPPLRVEFTEKPGAASIFKGQKRLKLVTHCQQAEKYQQDVLLEYSAYKLYNALTPLSFDARLVKVDYVNPDGSPLVSRYGFFIEDVSDVARRNGLERLRGVKTITASQLDPVAATRFAFLQYMISNLDWSMTAAPPGEDCCHNARLIGSKGATTGLTPLPYDFDYSGLVDAPYAVPPEAIRVPNVRVRRYRGFCLHNDQARTFAADLATRRAALLAIVDRTPQLSDTSRQKAAAYLGAFFDEVGSPSKVADMLNVCLR